MKLFNFKEFKENAASNEVTLKDYLSYLESNKVEIKEAMDTARELGLDESVSSELADNLEFLDKLLEIIDGYKRDIIIQSIDNLSLEDLQSLYENKIDIYKRELAEAEATLGYYNSQISKAEKEYNKNMFDNGYDKKYYEEADTENFFNRPATAYEYVKNLLEQDKLDEEELKQKLFTVLNFEAKKALKESDNNVINCMVDGIINLFVKCHKLNKMLSNKTEYIVNSLVANNGISRILVEFFRKNITEELFLDIQNIDRENTRFFKNLPELVQNKLKEERINGDCYRGLLDFYLAIENHSVEEFKPFDTVELDKLLKERESALKDVELAKSKIELEEKFVQDREKLREYLKSQIVNNGEKNISFSMLDNYIQTAQNEDNLEEIYNIQEFKRQKNEEIDRLREIYKAKESSLEKKVNLEQLSIDESVAEYIVDAELTRSDQISIMVNMERELEKLEGRIKQFKGSSLKSVLSGTNRKNIKLFKEKYNNLVEDTFRKLTDDYCSLLTIPSIGKNGKIASSLSKGKNVKSFDDLSYLAHDFWNLEEFEEQIVNFDLASKEDLDKLSKIQKYCVNKLFHFNKDEDGFYKFSIEEDERTTLLQCQESIVCLAKALYQKIKSINADNAIDEYAEELKSYGLTSFALEDIDAAIENCLSIVRDLDSEEERLSQQQNYYGIEGITTLDEAIKFRDMLIGISECYVPKEEIGMALKNR